jgi:orotate phosphoribosyltransferase
MDFDPGAFHQFLLENKVIGFFETPLKLKSGRISHWYVNCRVLSDRLGEIDRLADFVLAFSKKHGLYADYYYGVPEGATKLAVILNYKKGKSSNDRDQALVIGRGKPKEHGDPKDRYFIGPIQEGDAAIVIEDVTTTGGSLVQSIENLKESKIDVVAAIGLVNRMERRDDHRSVDQAISDLGVPYLAMSRATELLPLAREISGPSPSVWQEVLEYFDQYGIEPLKI